MRLSAEAFVLVEMIGVDMKIKTFQYSESNGWTFSSEIKMSIWALSVPRRLRGSRNYFG